MSANKTIVTLLSGELNNALSNAAIISAVKASEPRRGGARTPYIELVVTEGQAVFFGCDRHLAVRLPVPAITTVAAGEQRAFRLNLDWAKAISAGLKECAAEAKRSEIGQLVVTLELDEDSLEVRAQRPYDCPVYGERFEGPEGIGPSISALFDRAVAYPRHEDPFPLMLSQFATLGKLKDLRPGATPTPAWVSTGAERKSGLIQVGDWMSVLFLCETHHGAPGSVPPLLGTARTLTEEAERELAGAEVAA